MCEHSDHWGTEPHSRPVTISPCLIRFVPESSRNHARTNEIVPLLLAPKHGPTLATKCHRRGKSTWPDRDSNPGPLAYRVSTLTTEPHDRPVTISPCLIRFIPESAWNHVGTKETVPLLLAARARTHNEPPNVTGEEKAHCPTGTRTQDLSHAMWALWPLSYRATQSTCDNHVYHIQVYSWCIFLHYVQSSVHFFWCLAFVEAMLLKIMPNRRLTTHLFCKHALRSS